jgi:hypothetical protein
MVKHQCSVATFSRSQNVGLSSAINAGSGGSLRMGNETVRSMELLRGCAAYPKISQRLLQ